AYDSGKRPGYAIGLVDEGNLVFARGYGMADIARETPITADTAFNLASVSKQFTAAAIAKAILAGDIALTDKLAEHWDGLPPVYAPIEIGHLVYMTSGLPEYYTLPSPKGGWTSEDRFTVNDAIETVFRANRLEYTPGSRWTYSNINYQLLAEVAARQSGKPFDVHMNEAIFAPLGMDNTWVDAPIDMARETRATSYYWNDETSGWTKAPRLSPHYGGSGMFSSLRDLARWDAALYSDKAFGEAFTAQMIAKRRYDHDKTNDAFGLVHSTYRGQPIIWYEGGDYGVSTYMVRMPDRDQTLICLSNIGNGRCAQKAMSVVDVLLAFDADADFVVD
ncbi:MAG: serine hydrolase domain-containing protein, partial [Pseudomonadota bacterium]